MGTLFSLNCRRVDLIESREKEKKKRADRARLLPLGQALLKSERRWKKRLGR